MAFKSEQTLHDTAGAQHLEHAQQALGRARRRLFGATILLALACALIPWMLDSAPRAWGDDVILRMPQNDQPYQSKPELNPNALTTPVVAAPSVASGLSTGSSNVPLTASSTGVSLDSAAVATPPPSNLSTNAKPPVQAKP